MECCQEELDKGFLEFSNAIKRVRVSRTLDIKNSYVVYDGFKYYRKIRPKESKYVLTESQYFSIIRKVNKLIGDSLIDGEEIT